MLHGAFNVLQGASRAAHSERREFLALQLVIGDKKIGDGLRQSFIEMRSGKHRLARLSVQRNGDDPIIAFAVTVLRLLGFQNANHFAEHKATDGHGFLAEEKHIERVAVGSLSGRQKAEIEGKGLAHGQQLFEAKAAKVLVILHFRARSLGGLDDDVEGFAVKGGQFMDARVCGHKMKTLPAATRQQAEFSLAPRCSGPERRYIRAFAHDRPIIRVSALRRRAGLREGLVYHGMVKQKPKKRLPFQNGESRIERPSRIFLLSPANAAGERAKLMLREQASFPLARRLQEEGLPLGEAFSFISGLYFRGKLAYARAFAVAPPNVPGILVITACGGLVSPDRVVTREELVRISAGSVEAHEPKYRIPLERDARILASLLDANAEIVLLGSVATPKYVEPLLGVFGERLLFPAEFAGRGDMSRGGLMLRCVRAGAQLTYISVSTGERHGAKPPRLPKLRKAAGAASGVLVISK
jgi:hypothetical protein